MRRCIIITPPLLSTRTLLCSAVYIIIGIHIVKVNNTKISNELLRRCSVYKRKELYHEALEEIDEALHLDQDNLKYLNSKKECLEKLGLEKSSEYQELCELISYLASPT